MIHFSKLHRKRAFWAVALVSMTICTWQRGLLADRRQPDDEERRAPELRVEAEAAKAQAETGSRVCTPREIPFDGGEGLRVVRIDIHDTIDLGLAPFVVRVIEEAEEEGASLVLLHMDTPGGRVDAAQQIKDALIKSKVKTATFIDTHSLSAGALIAYATDYIIVSDASTIGAATPIQLGGQGEAKAVGEKFVSAMRAIFRATAEAKGRDPDIAEAMVDKEIVVDGLVDDEKLLTLSGKEAMTWCVADLQARDVAGVLSVLNLQGAEVQKRELNWAERIARVLTDPVVSGMLMTFGFLGILLELYTAGFGISGIIGICCLLLFFLGHMVVNLVGFEEILLFVLGLGLLAFEIFVTPGFGLAGGLGIAALVVSVVLSMVGSDVTFSWQAGYLSTAIWRMAITLVGTIVLFILGARYLPKTSLFNRLVLQGAIQQTSFEDEPQEDQLPEGTPGVAQTAIRGSGKARFGDRVLDVVTQGEFIERGEAIQVVEARGGRVVVGRREG